MNERSIKLGIVTLTTRWVARVWTIASIGFVLLILVGELLFPHAPLPMFRDLVGLFFFPFGVCVGMLLSWRWEGLGGGITVGQPSSFLRGVAHHAWPVSTWPVLCAHSRARLPIPAIIGNHHRHEEDNGRIASNALELLRGTCSSTTIAPQKHEGS